MSRTLTRKRYLELLERVLFDGHWPLVKNAEREKTAIRIFGSLVDEKGLLIRTADGRAIDAEAWEVEQFRSMVGDLQHELGPPGLTDHLKTLNVYTSDVELKRFFARRRHGEYPKHPTAYRMPVRSLDGYVPHLSSLLA